MIALGLVFEKNKIYLYDRSYNLGETTIDVAQINVQYNNGLASIVFDVNNYCNTRREFDEILSITGRQLGFPDDVLQDGYYKFTYIVNNTEVVVLNHMYTDNIEEKMAQLVAPISDKIDLIIKTSEAIDVFDVYKSALVYSIYSNLYLNYLKLNSDDIVKQIDRLNRLLK